MMITAVVVSVEERAEDVCVLLQAERLLSIEDQLRRRVVGQDEAIKVIANCIRLSRAGLRQPTKPLGIFLFLGPTG